MMRSLLFVVAAAAIAACSSTSDAPDTTDASAVTNEPTASSSSSSSSSGAPDDDDDPPKPRFVDTCTLQESCGPATAAERSGLAEVERCGFSLEESENLGATPELVSALAGLTTPVSVQDVLADANRVATKTNTVPGGPAGVQYAFEWQGDDDASIAWTPQGITGTADATDTGKVGQRSAVLVSFYDHPVPSSGEENRGVRIAFVDTTTAVAPKYRFVLLVAPKGTREAPSFDPIKIHAGGIVWYRDYLYVADTTRGFRVFDMRHLLRVAVDPGMFGCTNGTCRAGTYKYVLPQIGSYAVKSSCKPIFSWVSLDRKSDPPSLVSGEYCSGEACAGPLAGRIFRWPLDAATGLLRSKVTFPTEAYLMSHRQVQGGAFIDGVAYLSSSAPTNDGGDLYRVTKGKSATSKWGNNPEDLMVDAANGWLWSLTEKAETRSVFAVKLTSYPPP
ncbi:MAG: hypothetical protein KIT84_29850 [Labilithrix sp.]|nr:hypothetical protein [Labilithrix sp.]MCW5815268.1 hypothetical protein [Labilithrix sp.]